jgi:hypothetical protein
MCAQKTVRTRRIGVPQDWSQQQVVFTREGVLEHPEVLSREPRVLHQAMQRWQAPNSGVFRGVADQPPGTNAYAVDGSVGKRDWRVTLGQGRISSNMFPAKYSFDGAAPPSCTNDFAVFGLTVAGVTGGQANLVGFNNLYSGTSPTGICGSGGPSVLFAYNITTVAGGKITTSPLISEDGTKIAFVESVPSTQSIFHVLTWTPGGAISNAVAPASMASVVFAAANDTNSSPWIDYASDTAYIGADNGTVNKITGVFRGTPALAGGKWPISLARYHLSPPVLDSTLGYLMIGSDNGYLYEIDVNPGGNEGNFFSLAIGRTGARYAGIQAAPVVDVTHHTAFAVSANDGNSAVLVQADIRTGTPTSMARARIGQGAAGGAPPTTALYLYQPALDNNYYTNPSSGLIRVCGTGTGPGNTNPWQYAFGFTGSVMKTIASFSQQLLSSTAARCTGWTEFYNPNIGGGTDFFFFGLTQDCTATGLAGGCVVSRTSNTSLTFATLNGGPTGIIVDNYSTAAQASSIYMTAARFNAAYKFTQSGLQ